MQRKRHSCRSQTCLWDYPSTSLLSSNIFIRSLQVSIRPCHKTPIIAAVAVSHCTSWCLSNCIRYQLYKHRAPCTLPSHGNSALLSLVGTQHDYSRQMHGKPCEACITLCCHVLCSVTAAAVCSKLYDMCFAVGQGPHGTSLMPLGPQKEGRECSCMA